MSERVVKWMDIGYKGAVILGGVGIVWLNATFASKSDVSRIEEKIEVLNRTVMITNNNFDHFKVEMDAIRAMSRDIEIRIRTLEARR